MMSQILSILIDFYPGLYHIFDHFSNLQTFIILEREKILRLKLTVFLIFQGLSDRAIKIFMSFALSPYFGQGPGYPYNVQGGKPPVQLYHLVSDNNEPW